MCIHKECYESESNSQVSISTNAGGTQTRRVTMATHRKQEVGGGGRFAVATHLSSCPFSRDQLHVRVLASSPPLPHTLLHCKHASQEVMG